MGKEKELSLLLLQLWCTDSEEGPYTHKITIVDTVREHQVSPIREKDNTALFSSNETSG